MEPRVTDSLLGVENGERSARPGGQQRGTTRLAKLLTTTKGANPSSSQLPPRLIPTEKKRQIQWLQIESNGSKSYMHADKRTLVQRRNLKMPVRDLRVLDKAFVVQDSSNLLVRERCIVLSMEHVRIIITPDAVYAPVDHDCTLLERCFLERLESQALRYSLTMGSMDTVGGAKQDSTKGPLAAGPAFDGTGERGSATQPIGIPMVSGVSAALAARTVAQDAALPTLAEDKAGQLAPASASGDGPGAVDMHPGLHGTLLDDHDASEAGTATDRDIVPFETVILEAALDEVCAVLSKEAAELSEKAYPLLDQLSKGSEVSSEDLQMIRSLKGQHQQLRTRVDVVRMELEELLDDDKDLQKMCLSTRQELSEAAKDLRHIHGTGARTVRDSMGQSPQSFSFRNSLSRDRSDLLFDAPFGQSSGDLRDGRSSQSGMNELQQIREDGSGPTGEELDNMPSGRHSGLRSSAVSAIIAADMEEMENLLESYVTQIGATSFKLRTLGRYIEDTEDYINLDMDAARNRLIKLEVVLMAATFAIAVWAMVAGILGENMVIAPKWITKSQFGFIVVNVGMLTFCLLLFSVIIGHARRMRLI